jgi:hypothetical protein
MIHRVTIILAEYCPHCVPFSLSNAKKIAHDLNVPLRVLNIENSAQELLADKQQNLHGKTCSLAVITRLWCMNKLKPIGTRCTILWKTT